MENFFNEIDNFIIESNKEINEKINIFNKKIKKKIYKISALKNRGIIDIKKALIGYVH